MCSPSAPDPVQLSRTPGIDISPDVTNWVIDMARAAASYGHTTLPTAWDGMAPEDRTAAASLICVQLRYQADQGDEKARQFFQLFKRWRSPPAPPNCSEGSLTASSGELVAVTAYYNPARYQTRRDNYGKFTEGLRAQGVELFTVEAAFGGEPFELPAGPNVLQLRGRDVLWQKEQMLNELIRTLPTNYDKVAWLDCDILFENDMWASMASGLLLDFPVVQLFDEVEFLGRQGNPEPWAHGKDRAPGVIAASGNNFSKTHPGFAWAARRDFLNKHGLCCDQIAGSADSIMSLAFTGRLDHGQFHRYSQEMRAEFLRWAEPTYEDLRGRVSFVPGTIRHLWHGSHANRRYDERLELVKAAGFNPQKHLVTNDDGLLEWSDEAPTDLRNEMVAYFNQRGEDDDTTETMPEITCLMITGKSVERLPWARESVQAFRDQTYPHKRLIIVNDGEEAVLKHEEAGILEIFWPEDTGITLGELRNVAIEAARTPCLVQWDDDDVSHPDRLAYQVGFWKPYNAVMFRHEVHYNSLDGDLMAASARSWDLGGFPGTLMWDRRNSGHYPRTPKGEDSVFVERLKRQGLVSVIDNPPEMYVRRYNGLNTWDETHVIHNHRSAGARPLTDAERGEVEILLEMVTAE